MLRQGFFPCLASHAVRGKDTGYSERRNTPDIPVFIVKEAHVLEGNASLLLEPLEVMFLVGIAVNIHQTLKAYRWSLASSMSRVLQATGSSLGLLRICGDTLLALSLLAMTVAISSFYLA